MMTIVVKTGSRENATRNERNILRRSVTNQYPWHEFSHIIRLDIT